MAKAIKRSDKKVSSKQRMQTSGNFQLKARRQRINAPKVRGRGKAVCSACGAAYFDKHWHSCHDPVCRAEAAALPATLCEECRLKAAAAGGAGVHAGEVIVDGVTDAAELRDIRNLAQNVGERAAARDPEERIVKLTETAGGLVIYTSENQLAVSIGKQIHGARKGGELTITWSAEDKPVRVRWTAGQ